MTSTTAATSAGAFRRWRAGWRASLRMAGRDARKHLGRSILVTVMIALPVTAVAASDIVVRSHQLSAAERADQQLGTVADALVRVASDGPVEQAPDGVTWGEHRPPGPSGSSSQPGALEGPTSDPLSALPAGSRAAPVRENFTLLQSADDVAAPTASAQVVVTDATDPLAAGKYPTVAGRAPRAADEIEVTADLAGRLGVGVGDSVVTFRPDHTLRVVGIVGQRWAPGIDLAVGPINGALDPAVAADVAGAGAGSDAGSPDQYGTSYLVATPSPVRWSDVLRLNAAGLVVSSRAVYLDPPPSSAVPFFNRGSSVPAEAVTALAVAAGMALLEVVLLAGPAFAVSARRQRRELAVLAAVGGDRIDLRRTVLGQGVVLGGAGGVAGVGLGIALGLVARDVLAEHAHVVFGGLHWHVGEIAAAAVLGVVTGLLAAMLPARAASRQDVVAALAGRRGAVRSSRSLPVLGALAFLAGAGIAALGAQQAQRASFIIGGSIIAELGLVACTPLLVGLLGRLAPRLHGSLRLALRDAARNRSRSAPAVAAILAAAAGCVGVLVYSASADAHNRAAYVPTIASGDVMAHLPWPSDPTAAKVDPREVAAAVRSTLPVETAVVVDSAMCAGLVDCAQVSLVAPAGAASDDAVCGGGVCAAAVSSGAFGGELVGGADLVPVLTGHHAPAAEQMLRVGGVVVFDPSYVVEGKATFEVTTTKAPSHDGVGATDASPSSEKVLSGKVRLPAAVAPATGLSAPSFILSPQAAQKLGVAPWPVGVLASTTSMPSRHAEDLARTAVQRAGGIGLGVERGWRDPSAGLTLALIGIAALVIIGAAGVATGLAIADGRADHATLAAVGASPGVRRRLAAAQSALLGLLGAVTGAIAGVIPAAAVLHSHSVGRPRPYPLVLPWGSLTLLIVGVPLLGAACAWLFTTSRLPLGRRAT